MKSVTTAVAATAPATAPAPEAKPKPAMKGTMVRTIKVDFGQSGDLSVLVSRLIVQQRWAYNMAVREALRSPDVTFYDLCGMLTKWRNANRWLVRDDGAQAAGIRQAGNGRVQRAGLRQGLDAVQKFMESNAKKRSNKIMWKNLSRRDRESEGVKGIGTAANLPPNKWSGKRNRWSRANGLFRKKGERQALCVLERPVPKGGGLLHLPGIGTVRMHGDVEGLDMRSFQLVETTKKTTRRTGDRDRTYRLHVQARVEAPKSVECDIIRGVDMGIVHSATTVDLDTGYTEFHDIPDGCRRTKNDDISRMCAELSRKRGGSGNRRIRQNGKSGRQDKTGGQDRTNMKARHNRPRKPKSRGYKELQRRIRKRREKVANRQTDRERHASKRIADGAGTVVIEDLKVKNMTARAKGKGSSAKTGLNREMAYSRPGTFQRRIEGACANAGVKVISVYPGGTSTTCYMCGRRDKGSRVSQAEFICTNHKCECHINADVNAAYNIAARAAAGRRGTSSKGARFQAGIAPGRSANNTQEPRVGGIAGAPEKGKSTGLLLYVIPLKPAKPHIYLPAATSNRCKATVPGAKNSS